MKSDVNYRFYENCKKTKNTIFGSGTGAGAHTPGSGNPGISKQILPQEQDRTRLFAQEQDITRVMIDENVSV